MKIAYIAYEDFNDISAWSGTIAHIAKNLSKDNEIIPIDNLGCPWDIIFKFVPKIKSLLGFTSDFRRNKFFMKFIAKRIEKRLIGKQFDIIFAPGTLYISYLITEKPIVVWADATFASLVETYPQYSKMTKSEIETGNELEKSALGNVKKIIFSTTWAANSAISHYNIPESKVEVIPFGSNLNENFTLTDLAKLNVDKRKDKVKLLFVGVDWYKKGGDLLLDIYRELRLLSDKYELDVVGSNPDKIPIIEGVRFHGFLKKSDNEQNKKLISLFQQSHYFLLPTRAEAFGIVFCEANSYGLPAFGSELGGITDIIVNGVNGELIDIKQSAKLLAAKIHESINSGDYNEKSINAFNHYNQNFTWDNSIAKVNKVLQGLV
ncbi:MAG: glycosyltransferase family 4 protein [Candidatus Kapaibacterium sp.]